MKNPKLVKSANNIYHYYAGYSEEFVDDIINNHFKLKSNSILLDLWNGSGTTTTVAYKNNIRSYGFDINPSMQYIAQAKLLSQSDKPFIIEIFNKAMTKYNTRNTFKVSNLDLLSIWLTTSSIKNVRYLELKLSEQCQLKSASLSVSAFFIVLQFRLLKNLLEPFKTSNPTWIKHTVKNSDKLTINKATIKTIVKLIFNDMISNLIPDSDFKSIRRAPILLTASSYHLPLVDNSVDAIITSPPYCTRIDYAISTLPELAFLKLNHDTVKKLRYEMIGSTTISSNNNSALTIPSETAIRFLNNVINHTSKASNNYYIKYYQKYFNQLYMSLKEINRVLKTNGKCCIVIQNSYYKDLLLSLNIVVEEMLRYLGFDLLSSTCFQKKSTHTNANPTSKNYRKNKVIQYEYVLLFKKGDSHE